MAWKNKRRDRRNILGRNEAWKLLEPISDELVLAMRDGLAHFLAHFRSEVAAQMVPYRKRTKANMLNDAIVHYAKIHLNGIGDVVIDTDHDGTFFLVHEQVALYAVNPFLRF